MRKVMESNERSLNSTKVVIAPALDEILRPLSPSFIGVGTSPAIPTRAIYQRNAPDEDLKKAEMVIASYGTLEVKTDKLLIKADGKEEAVITCPVAYQTFRFNVWRQAFGSADWQPYASGSAATENGTATLELAVEVPGEYLVGVRREEGDYASGFVTVRAEKFTSPPTGMIHHAPTGGEGSKEKDGANGED